MSDSTLVFTCPKCQTVNTLQAPSTSGGKNHHCSKTGCGKVIQISWTTGYRITQVH